MENIQTGLLLLGVGMTTVFIILLLIIFLSQGLIALVNKYAPEEVIQKKVVLPAKVADVADSTTAAIISAVSIVTKGKGKVTKIEKV